MTLPAKELPEGSLDALIAHERARVVAPLTEWQALSAQLRDEGLVRSSDTPANHTSLPKHSVGAPARRSMVSQWSVRLMAGAALVLSGIVMGRVVTTGNPADQIVRGELQRTATGSASHSTFASVQEARQAVIRSQSEYQRAAAYLAAADTSAQVTGTPALYRERLAALDQVMSVTQRALKNAPQDPLLNQYYQSTMGAREATAQQLEQTLPVGARVSHF